MNSEAVIAMIEDLAHSIRRQYDVEITKLDWQQQSSVVQ
jgi:hypothetical protein